MGFLYVTADSAPTTVNLTSAGSVDWIHWPDNATVIRKSGGGSLISTWSRVDAASDTTNSYTNDPRTMTWSDGTPTGSGSDALGIYVGDLGNVHTGFQITAPASAQGRKLILNCGYFNTEAKLTVSLSDGSAPSYTETTPLFGAISIDRNYVINYAADSSATLTVTWQNNASSGNVTMNGASLALLASPSTNSVPSGTAIPVGNLSPKFLFFDTGDYTL